MSPHSSLPTPHSSDEIRTEFIKFWQAKGSHLQPSSSLIPYDDPTVLLTTAGMQQFVPYFLGKAQAPFARYVSAQKCFRTSDIDEVGDRSHLTFFEMLGNFSMGDYFKQEVIPWALEFSTTRLGLDNEKLWITIHDSDDEANEIWLQTGFPPDRIKRFGDEHNWWGPPGKSGPCGPNSELYYEQGPGFGCGFPEHPPECDCGRLEFWNLVFMQFFQDEAGVRTPLPRQNVDTGMGLERAVVVAQGLKTIYDTDLFQPILHTAARIAGTAYGQNEQTDYGLRVLTDHSRGMTFLVLDGVVPGNTGREYVLRRLIRRAIRYGRLLGIDRPFLKELVDAVVERMRPHYPELQAERGRIQQVIGYEEEQFRRTLQAGTLQIERIIVETGTGEVSGQRAFDLYQTYGFPIELTEEMLGEKGLTVNRAEFDAALDAERERARSVARFQHEQHATSSEFGGLPPTQFLAWTDTRTESRVLAAVTDAGPVSELTTGARGRLVLEASPFYPLGGGQVGDTGWIRSDGGTFVVEDTQMDGAGHVVHSGHVESGTVSVGDLARAEVDAQRRDRSRRHHTATHLLHRALKDVLGEGTSQQGSYVGPDQLRFDFNHPRPVGRQELQDVAHVINERSMDDLPVNWDIMPLDQARQLGAIMMFGEKYGDEVRVVSIGDYSRELCGGTHTHHSGELGAVVIASESGIGSGLRRIVGYAGQPALDYLNGRLRTLESVAERLGTRSTDEVEQRIDALHGELERLRREVDRRQHEQARDAAGSLADSAREIGGVKVVVQALDHADEAELKRVVDAVRQGIRSGVVVLGTRQDGQLRFVAGVTPDLTQRVRAGDIIKAVARQAGGGGGGRPEFATGGGTQPEKLQAALEHAYTVVQEALAS
ncbi:MAG TPA: alanine--tRNA ligase [Chloroflexota bacterium]